MTQVSFIELKLTRAMVADCTTPGQDAEESVRYYASQPRFARQLDRIDPATIARCLKGYGAWDAEELADAEMNRIRLLWIAAGNAKDAMWSGEPSPCTVYLD